MFKNITLFALSVNAILTGCSTNNENNDFNSLCKVYENVVNSSDYVEMSSEERGAKLELLVAKSLNSSSNAYLALSAIQYASPEQRYYLFKEAAKSVGYESWYCAAIEKHGHEIGFE